MTAYLSYIKISSHSSIGRNLA